MSGTSKGGFKAAKTNKRLYGGDFYKTIGRLGGQKSRGGGFEKSPELAKAAGTRGGQTTQARYKGKKRSEY